MVTKFQIGCVVGLMLFVGICIGSYWQKQSCKPLGELQEGHIDTMITNHSMMNFHYDGRIEYINWTVDDEGDFLGRNNEIEFIDKDMVNVFNKNNCIRNWGER